MEQQSGSSNSEQERSSKRTQTSCAGTEPYYRVPILQRVISPAPGYSSALYSVQVMTQSEVDTMKSHQRSSCQVLPVFSIFAQNRIHNHTCMIFLCSYQLDI